MRFEELAYMGLGGGGQTLEDFAPMRTKGGCNCTRIRKLQTLQVTAGGYINKVIGIASGKLIKNDIIRH